MMYRRNFVMYAMMISNLFCMHVHAMDKDAPLSPPEYSAVASGAVEVGLLREEVRGLKDLVAENQKIHGGKSVGFEELLNKRIAALEERCSALEAGEALKKFKAENEQSAIALENRMSKDVNAAEERLNRTINGAEGQININAQALERRCQVLENSNIRAQEQNRLLAALPARVRTLELGDPAINALPRRVTALEQRPAVAPDPDQALQRRVTDFEQRQSFINMFFGVGVTGAGLYALASNRYAPRATVNTPSATVQTSPSVFVKGAIKGANAAGVVASSFVDLVCRHPNRSSLVGAAVLWQAANHVQPARGRLSMKRTVPNIAFTVGAMGGFVAAGSLALDGQFKSALCVSALSASSWRMANALDNHVDR